jgi:hypothetical protein
LTGIDFALATQEMGWLELTVLDPKGEPCAAVSFEVTSGEVVSTFSGKHVGEGRHRIQLHAGKHTVKLWAHGANAETLVVQVSGGRTVERKVKLTPRPK